ncbi:MAG: histidine--tRNA ligase [Bradymonadia bacterium]
MSKIKPQTLRGFRDYLPDIMGPKQQMLDAVARVFESYGFGPLQTPALEYSSVLLGKYGDEGDKLLYRFKDNGDRDVALRYDLTVPLARVAAANPHLPKPFKRYQIAPVWRAESPGRGRYREFMQCDVDIVGNDSMMADAECLAVGAATLRALGVEQFTLRINNRKLLTGLFDKLGLDQGEAALEVLRVIDKLPKIGEAKVRGLLAEECGLSAEAVDSVFDFLSRDPETLGDFFEGVETGLKGVEELTTVLDLAKAQGLSDQVAVDLSIARGLDYYTGTIYETFLTGMEDIGSVMSGGRYDGLMSMYGNQPMPSVGISLGVDRLLAALIEMELVTLRPSPTRVLITNFNDGMVSHSYTLASTLRDQGINAEVFLGTPKLKKQLAYANKMKIPFAIVLGPDEVAEGLAQVKDLSTGGQSKVPVAQIAEVLAAGIPKAG